MRTYKITVNGQVYNVDVEEIGASAPVAAAPVAAPVAAPAAAPAPAAATAPAATFTGAVLAAPPTGNILRVNVTVGQTVTLGQTIGYVGTTALLETSLGDHVHFSVTCNGKREKCLSHSHNPCIRHKQVFPLGNQQEPIAF